MQVWQVLILFEIIVVVRKKLLLYTRKNYILLSVLLRTAFCGYFWTLTVHLRVLCLALKHSEPGTFQVICTFTGLYLLCHTIKSSLENAPVVDFSPGPKIPLLSVRNNTI